jgi:dTDP-glucose 4,6-dehydratase
MGVRLRRSFCYVVNDLVEGIYRLLMSDYTMPVKYWKPRRDYFEGFC